MKKILLLSWSSTAELVLYLRKKLKHYVFVYITDWLKKENLEMLRYFGKLYDPVNKESELSAIVGFTVTILFF